MRRIYILLLTLLFVACGDGQRSRRAQPETADKQQPVTPPGSRPTTADTTLPKLVGFRQEGLEQIVVEFSEPIKRITNLKLSPAFGKERWSEDRKVLYAPFDVKKIRDESMAKFYISGIIDDAENSSTELYTIPVDCIAPFIEGVKVLGNQTILMTFNESVTLSVESNFLIDGKHPGTLVRTEFPAKQVMVVFDGIDLTTAESHVLTLANVSDVYGNLAEKRSRGFAYGDDKEAPRITSIRQLPTMRSEGLARLGFELKFSEYVVDSRDYEGVVKDIQGLLDSMKVITVNGKEVINILGQWIPHEDHKGATLYLPALMIEAQFENNKENTIGVELTDPLGNSQLASASLVVDSEAPWVQGSYKDEHCAMKDLKEFRCRITEADVASAVLKPEERWPVGDYVVSVSTEASADGAEQNWVHFKFQKDIPEHQIDDIVIIDKIGNTNKDLISQKIGYYPTSTRPEIIRATAFNNHVLELQFSLDVGSIDAVLVDGVEKKFKMTFTDNFRSSYKPANVVLHFSEPVADGLHKLEVRGAARIRNRSAKSESLILENLDNRLIDILQSSITQEPDLWRTTDLRFEMTQPLLNNTFFAFARVSGINSTLVTTPIRDFYLTLEGITPRRTYAYRMHKETAAGLLPLQYNQGIVLQILGRTPTVPVFTTWSTEEPRFYVEGYARADGFVISNLVQLDLDSLEMEIVNGTETMAVERSWISAYVSEDGRNHGFQVNLPEPIRLKTDDYFSKLRVKKARTINFGIELTKPLDVALRFKRS